MGMVVTQVRDSIYLTDLVARSPDEQRESLQTLKNLQVALDRTDHPFEPGDECPIQARTALDLAS